MKNFTKLLLVIISAGFISGCALHSGNMSGSASLSQANFDYMHQSIKGTASTTRVLGIGGLAKSALLEAAKNDMTDNFRLEENQALVNITVNWKRGFYLIVSNNKCTVTADIVEFK